MAEEKTPEYFYVGDSAPTKTKTITPTRKQKSNNASDLVNPIFNFDRSFGENLLKLNAADIGKSQPYISISIMDLGGKELDNLNVSFFHKQIDFKNINSVERFNDRPLISLQSIEITQDQSFGPIHVNNVDLNIKVHKKDQLSDRTLLGLLFPGCPLMIEYGWNSSNEFLNESKQKLLLNVVNYDITLDETGQADLVVHCMGFQDVFSNTIIGDLNTIEFSNEDVKGNEFKGLFQRYAHLTEFLKYIDLLKQSKNQNQNDYSIVLNLAEGYRNLEQKARGKISKNFTTALNKLSEPKLITSENFGKKKKVPVISFHDLIYTLCNDTFKSLTALIPCKKFEVIYGAFNEKCLDYSGKSIADFPIDWNVFSSWIKDRTSKGQRVIYIKDLLNTLVADYIENDEYIKKANKSGGTDFDPPDITVSFTNIGDVLILMILDTKNGIPITTNELPKGKSSIGEVEKSFGKKDIPFISLSHMNSFIKNVSFSRVTDANIETVLIERALNSSYFSPRDPILNSELQKAQASTPLTLPLQGTATVLGHVAWKPFRAFYLSTGIFMIDAVYVIQKVTHTLSREGFETQIEFRWH